MRLIHIHIFLSRVVRRQGTLCANVHKQSFINVIICYSMRYEEGGERMKKKQRFFQ